MSRFSLEFFTSSERRPQVIVFCSNHRGLKQMLYRPIIVTTEESVETVVRHSNQRINIKWQKSLSTSGISSAFINLYHGTLIRH